MEGEDPNLIGQFTRVSQLLRKSGLDVDEANELTEHVGNMASSNVLDRIDASNAQFQAKIDALDKTLETKIDAQNAKYNVLIWVISFATVILSAVILFSRSGG